MKPQKTRAPAPARTSSVLSLSKKNCRENRESARGESLRTEENTEAASVVNVESGDVGHRPYNLKTYLYFKLKSTINVFFFLVCFKMKKVSLPMSLSPSAAINHQPRRHCQWSAFSEVNTHVLRATEESEAGQNELRSVSCCSSSSVLRSGLQSPPKVQVYSRNPGEFGKENTLICHVTNFHPPDISIQLMKDGQEIPNAMQTDLAFKQDWHFHLTKSSQTCKAQQRHSLCAGAASVGGV
ncbi:hypothetical protein INR49_000204 [Caranx melampygus]|nr:hypothetical protein INR49_000204 [Caranx melampygus]